MSQAHVPLQELVATVERMQRRLAARSDIADLWAAYERLVPRFEMELSASERDIALAKSSALMVLQEVAASKTR